MFEYLMSCPHKYLIYINIPEVKMQDTKKINIKDWEKQKVDNNSDFKDLRNFQKTNKLIFVLLWSICLTGFLFGVFFVFFGKENILDFVGEWFEKILQQKSGWDFFAVFLHNANSILICIVIIFLLGLSPVLSFLLNFVLFVKGVGLGLNTSYIYINYGWRGIVYELLIDIPVKLIFFVAIVFEAKEAMSFSKKIRLLLKNNPNINFNINFKKYMTDFVLIFFGIIFVVLIYTMLDFCFFNYLNIL